MSRLTDLLRQARQADAQLGADLEAEFRALSKRRTFGLVFEQHQPEAVELPGRAIRRGDKVRVLLPRGQARSSAVDQRVWRVRALERSRDGERGAIAQLVENGIDQPETRTVAVEDLVVIAEFRDIIYPGLFETGRVERGGGKPFHTVINAENYHALEMLTYTHRHMVDAIYIDPPYNTGAKDWKYNNDYVEGDDSYRHSKWLAMMERRLRVARELLNPEDSVLIVTIDEKEVHRLGLLLEQTFPETRAQMVTIVIQGAGSVRSGELSRSEEYAFFCFFGRANPSSWTDDMLSEKPSTSKDKVRWESLLRSGTHSERWERPNLFFPMFVCKETGRIVGVGEQRDATAPKGSWDVPSGAFAVWPTKSGGEEGNWRVSVGELRRLVKGGFVRAGRCDEGTGTGTFWYLGRLARRNIEDGTYIVSGRDEQGALRVNVASASDKRFPPRTVWTRARHNAGWHGTNLLRALLPGRRFPFPKSLYAVEDCLRVAVAEKPNAVILDFFAGSGTTAHAVMRLNHQDGGRRQCISVTNNEVAAEEQRGLRTKGLRPGDADWESRGICDYITKPRIEAAITGVTPTGERIDKGYKFTDEFPISEGLDENAAFFTLTYEGPLSVAHHKAFGRVAPMLWLRAGARGRLIDGLGGKGWDVAETYGVLENLDQAKMFADRLAQVEGVRLAFIVTDDESAFQMVVRDLPGTVKSVRLYESYLHNFQIDSGRLS